MNEFQLDMTLNKNSNPFKNALDNGNFVFLAESTPPENEQNINSAIERLSAENRTLTIVVIAHRDSSLGYCDRIITLGE